MAQADIEKDNLQIEKITTGQLKNRLTSLLKGLDVESAEHVIAVLDAKIIKNLNNKTADKPDQKKADDKPSQKRLSAHGDMDVAHIVAKERMSQKYQRQRIVSRASKRNAAKQQLSRSGSASIVLEPGKWMSNSINVGALRDHFWRKAKPF